MCDHILVLHIYSVTPITWLLPRLMEWFFLDRLNIFAFFSFYSQNIFSPSLCLSLHPHCPMPSLFYTVGQEWGFNCSFMFIATSLWKSCTDICFQKALLLLCLATCSRCWFNLYKGAQPKPCKSVKQPKGWGSIWNKTVCSLRNSCSEITQFICHYTRQHFLKNC